MRGTKEDYAGASEDRYPKVSLTTQTPMWGHSRFVLGAIGSFLEPFQGHLSPKIDKVSEKLTLRYPHEGPCVVLARCCRRSASGVDADPRSVSSPYSVHAERGSQTR